MLLTSTLTLFEFPQLNTAMLARLESNEFVLTKSDVVVGVLDENVLVESNPVLAFQFAKL